MKCESIVKLSEHIAAQEVSHGVQDAFGFKNILSSHKQSALLPSHYSSANSGADDDTTPAPAPAPEKNPNLRGEKQLAITMIMLNLQVHNPAHNSSKHSITQVSHH